MASKLLFISILSLIIVGVGAVNIITDNFITVGNSTIEGNLNVTGHITANSGEIANLSITENFTTVIINSVGGKDICIGNC